VSIRILAAVGVVLAVGPAFAAWEWPRGLERQVEKARALQEQGKDQEAIELLNGLVAGTTPLGRARVYTAIGDTEQKRERFAEAQRAYEKALAMNAVSPYERVELTQALDDEYLRAANHDVGRALLRGYLTWLDETAPGLPEASSGDLQNSRELIEASRGHILHRLARHDEAEGKTLDAVANIDAAISSTARPPREWREYKIAVLCNSSEGVKCVEAIVELARLSRIRATKAEELDRFLHDLAGDPAVAPTIDAAREAGLVSDRNEIVRRFAPGYVEGEVLVQVYPRLPPQAIREKISGWVDFDFQIDPEGKPTDIRITASQPSGFFNAAAIVAFSRWRFAPVVVDGKPAVARSIRRIVFQP